jgi:hypothetical protein
MLVSLVTILSLAVAGEFHGKLLLEDGEERASYLLDSREGSLRIEPVDAEVFLILDVTSRTITFVDKDRGFFCRLQAESFQRLVRNGAIRLSWFPWVYPVSSDLVENLVLEKDESARLPDGRRGVRVVAHSKTYDRVVAEYWLDPELPPDLFFQWRTIYLDFWGEGDVEADQAQQTRLELYKDMPGFPVKVEERFVLLTRPRTLTLENLGPVPEDAFDVPANFVEKTEKELLWQDLLRRLERWIRPSSE